MKKLIISLLIVAATGLTGCEKWLDVNKNPNDATRATPDLILPGVLKVWAEDMDPLKTTFGAWMGYWAHAGGWSGWYTTKKYEITSSFMSLYGYYTGPLTDSRFVRINSGTNVVYPAITDVVDAWYYSHLVDAYGDVPYSEACQPDLTLTPRYDDDKEIYLDLIARLTNAVNVFYNKVNAPDASTNSIYAFKNTVDIVFNGNFDNWRKLANTLKLRLVMRMTGDMTATELKALMDNTADKGFLTSNAYINPGYVKSSGKTNPVWNTFGMSYTDVITSANTQYTLNAYMHRKLQNTVDPRLNALWFAPASAPAGALVSLKFGTDGDLTVQPNTTVAANYHWVLISSDAGVNPTTKVKTGSAGALEGTVLFLASESYFLQAEALARGILDPNDIGTNVNAAFRDGITASLNACKVSSADQTTYMSAVADITGDPLSVKVQKIIEEKWIANYFLNHFESWCDYRRTGYPDPVGLGPDYEMLSYYPGGIIKRQIPRLFPYPQGDYDLNKVNTQAAITKQGVPFTTNEYPFNARVFWDKAPVK